MRYSLIPLLLTLTIASKLPLSEANAQMLWNPPVGAFSYTVPDGSNHAEWLRSSVSGAGALWWNGTQNVVAADNASVAFEGTGVVGPASGTTSVNNSGRANTIIFRSLTGPYTLRLNPWLGNTLEVAAGVAHDVSLSGQIQFSGAGTRTIRNNGSAWLHIANGFNRQLSGSGRIVVVDGSGPVRIDNNFVFRTDLNDNAQLIKNGSGRLELSHSTYDNLQAGITFNAGELYFSHPTAEIVIPSLTWNSGTLIYSLSNSVSNSNRQLIQGALTRSGSGPYVFDFQNTGTDRTYTLLLFQSTNFELSDFQAINVASGGFFSWGSEQRGGVEYQSLRFTVTVPFDPGPEPDPEPEPQPETGPILSPTPVNLALNRPATSGPLWTEAYWLEPAYTPQRAFDGDTASDNSRWIGTGLPNWIEVDLGWNYQISGLRFWTGTASSPFPITGYNLQYWNGSSWTAIFSRTDSSNNGFEQVTFPPVVAGNRVRFNITALRDDNITRLYELEILGVVHDLYHTQLSPMSGGDLLDVAAPLQVVFSEAVEVGSVSGVVLRNLTANSEVPIVSVAVQGDTLSLLHGGLTPGHRYAVHLPPGVVSKSGQAAIQSGALYWEFQTLPAAPQVRTFPRDAVSVTADLRYTFDRDVTLVDGSGVRILLADDFSELAGVSVTLTDNRTLNIAHVPFVPGTRYIVDIPAGTVQGLHNGVVNNPIRRAFYSARFNLFSSDFDGSFDGFSTAAMLGAVPSNQSHPWASSPVVFLRAGETYTLEFKARITTSGDNTFQMRANALTQTGFPTLDQRVGQMEFTVRPFPGPGGREFETIRRTFTVPEDGAYHITFYPHTNAGSLFLGIQIDDVRIIGDLNAAPSATWNSPTADVRTLAGTDILLRADPVDSDGFITRVAFVTAAGELLTAQADLSAAPWEYVWQDVPEGECEVFIYVEDNAGGFALSGPRRITVLPNTLNISTYLGSANASESFTGAAHQSDGTIVLTGIMDPQLLPGNPPVLHLNGAQSGDRGVVVRLSGDAQTVLSVSVVSEQVLDVALDAQDRIYVAAGSRGAVVLSPDGTQVLFNETYGTRLAHRIDAAPGGAFALVASTQTDWRDERTGNTTIPIYDANWVLQSNLGGPAFTRDLAICEVNEVVVLIGFKNITDMDMPPTSSQFGELNPVDIPIMIGRNFNGTLRWRGYDWERFIDNPSRHLNNPTNNMADTRGHRVIIGPDGHIYAAFEFDGGNHPLRYSPLDVNESVQHLIVGGDNFFNTANTGTLPKVFVGRYRLQTGEMLLGQQLINRNPGNVESTLRIKNGALFVDTSRFIHLSGTSASGLPMTVEPLVGVNYSGGAWYMVLSPDMRSRELVTRFIRWFGFFGHGSQLQSGAFGCILEPCEPIFGSQPWQPSFGWLES